jgi:predicted transcriptional regulator
MGTALNGGGFAQVRTRVQYCRWHDFTLQSTPIHQMPRTPAARSPTSDAATPLRRAGLGPLETSVLESLWAYARPSTVHHVRASFPELAYTTLMTKLDRLYRKGLLLRRRRGRAFMYEPRCSRDELLGEMVSGHFTELLSGRGTNTAILSTLVHAVGRRDAALLDELDALVQAERARLKTGAP